ncbi:hypothetical protein EDD11_009697 [Mortierella claussenii]|nr:hypothetical protein EDD11_009697 [Mortierella claussenii]
MQLQHFIFACVSMMSVAAAPIGLNPVGDNFPSDTGISGLGSNYLASDNGPLAPNSLLGNLLSKKDSILSTPTRKNNGNILKTIGQGLSELTSDCNTILGPLTGTRTGVLTASLFNKGKLLGDLTDYRSGSLNNLSFDAFYGYCQGLGKVVKG